MRVLENYHIERKKGACVVSARVNLRFSDVDWPNGEEERMVLSERIDSITDNYGVFRDYLRAHESLLVVYRTARCFKGWLRSEVGIKRPGFRFCGFSKTKRGALMKFVPSRDGLGFDIGVVEEDGDLSPENIINLNALENFILTGEISGKSYDERLSQ